MSIFTRTPHAFGTQDLLEGNSPDASPDAISRPLSTTAHQALGLLRIAFGLTFLWAFFDKLFGLGYSTKSGDSWLNGGSPTSGFLKFGAEGPLKSFYNGIGGNPWLDALFMASLLALGVALTFGIGMRLAGIGGAVLYLLMWTVALPPANNPILDEHVLGAITVAVLALTSSGNTWGMGKMWANSTLAKRFPILR